MTSRHGADKNELLLEDLTPWLKSTAWAEDVPPSDLADVVTEAQAKALSVLRDMERGERRRLPSRELEPYIKVVMRNAIRDWKHRQPKASSLSPDERALIDSGFFPIGKDAGDEGASALPTIHVPKGPRAPAQPLPPPLLTLVRQPFWRKPDVSAEYVRVQERLNAIPNDCRREAMSLHLQGYQQEQIAERLLVTQPYVSRVLREQKAAWGWDDERVLIVRWLTAYANLIRLFGRVFPDAELFFPQPRRQPFQEVDLNLKEEARQASLRRLEEIRRTPERLLELPRDEAAYNRSRNAHYLSGENGIVDHSSEGPQQGRKERGQGKLNRLKEQEAELYRAIKNDPALARWTKDLKFYHMPQLVTRVLRDDYEWYKEWKEWVGGA